MCCMAGTTPWSVAAWTGRYRAGDDVRQEKRPILLGKGLVCLLSIAVVAEPLVRGYIARDVREDPFLRSTALKSAMLRTRLRSRSDASVRNMRWREV